MSETVCIGLSITHGFRHQLGVLEQMPYRQGASTRLLGPPSMPETECFSLEEGIIGELLINQTDI